MPARILIIEDNPANLELVRYLLKANGYTTLTAQDGGEGIQIAREASPDLVLCDLQMPVLDGYGVLSEIRSDPKLRDTRVIAVTAFSMSGDRSKVFSAGFDGYIAKPIDPERFVAQVEAYLLPELRAAPPPPASRTMAAVLVVDDNATNRELIVTLLRYKGHRSLEAADGAEALARVRKERPDVVICDILMPTMDGYEFVRLLRADPTIAHTEVIFYTAYYREEEARNLAKACGVSRVLVKPSVPEDIIDAIEQALAHAKQPDPQRIVTDEFGREHLRLMTDKLSDKANKLERANQRLSALTDLNLQLASERDPHTLLDQVCRGARDLIGAKYAVLCVNDKSAGDTIYSTVSGIDATIAAHLTQPHMDNDILGPVLRKRAPLRFVNPGADPRAIGLPADYPPANSVLACPIASLDSTYGWICLSEKLGADGFSEEDEHLLRIYAAQVGRIYENGSLYAQMQRHSAQLQASEARMREGDAALRRAQLMARLAHVITRADGSIESWSDTLPLLFGVDPSRMPESTRAWLDLVHPDDRASFRATSVEAGIHGVRKDIEYRLQRGDEWIHMKHVMEPIQGQSDADGKTRWFSTLQDVTDQKKFEKRIGRLNRVYAVLSGINALIVRVQDRNELFRGACRIAVEAGQFRLAWIGVVDRRAKQVNPVAWHGTGEDYIRLMPMGLDENQAESFGLVGRAVVERKPMVEHDMTSDPAVALSTVAAQRDFHSLVILPLLASGEVAGVMALYTGETGFFDGQEMKLLLELAGDITFALDHIAKKEKLDYLAFYDPLTGAPNRALFRERLAQQVTAATREQQRLAVVLLDIERLTIINDTLGRPTGDELLKLIAVRSSSIAVDPASFARLVGDQFAVVIPDVRIEDDVARIVEQKNREIFGASYRVGDTELRVSAKFGIAVFPGDGADADTLLQNAEAALRRAKSTGERYLFYTQQMTERVAGHLTLENKLRQAQENNEFVLHYQPKVDVETRRIMGLEALMRWQSPDLGLVQPLRFIPLLEETGMILDVGAWALRQAALDHRQWVEQQLAAPRIAVNVSAIQLRHRDFVDVVKDALRRGADLPAIDIEITESVIMEDVAGTIDKLKTLRDLDVSIAIDDFGTGYSSLAYLAKLRVHSLKIDRSFIVTMADNPDTMTLVSTIISLAHSLRLKVCAEGVETEDQANILRLLQCDEMQGYLFSRPVPLEELTRLLAPQ